VTLPTLLFGLAAVLALSAARELAAALPKGAVRRRLPRPPISLQPWAAALPARLGGALSGALLAWLTMPVAPGRTAVALALGMPAAGFLAPQALLERRARLRRRRLVAALPDALDLLAVNSVSGRSPANGFAELARRASGPLAEEMRITVAETNCGQPLAAALASLRRRAPGAEVARLCAALERSRVLGSPLADQLRRQATSLRQDQRLLVEERAARAAPKIQLIVALVLVPSVLLMIAAALIANADLLLAGFA
jgi:tight adherence protein C